MKVCMISSPVSGELKDGIGSHVLELSRHIANIGWEVHVVCFGKVSGDSFANGIYVHQVKVSSHGSRFILYPQLLLRVAREINRLNKKYNFDVVHGHGGYAIGAVMPHLSRSIGASIVTIHGVAYGEFLDRIMEKGLSERGSFENFSLRKTLAAGLYLPFTRIVGTLVYNLNDSDIATCNFVAKEASRIYHIPFSKIMIVPHSIDAQRFSAVDDPYFRGLLDLAGRKVVLYAGQLVARKGLPTLINAFSIVRKSIPDAVLLCVGKGYMKGSLRLQAKRLGIEEHVLIYDQYIAEKAFPRIYSVGDVFVVPSIYESGISTCLLQAMSSKKAVVATNIGAFPEIICNGFNGLLVEKSNAIQLADSINLLLTKQKYSEELGDKARETILSRFDWGINAKGLVEIYERHVKW